MLKSSSGGSGGPTKRARGDAAEAQALAWLQKQGLVLVERHYQVARGPFARGGEIDLVLRERDGTLVFCEVRSRRAGSAAGGAAASVGAAKQARLVYAAQHYLMRFRTPPRCRFDVVAIDGEHVAWLRGAFDAGGP